MKKSIIIFLALFIQTAFTQTCYYVKTDGNNSNNGLSWGAAKASIQAAHDAAATGDVILVKYGTYTLTTNISVSKNVKITSDDGNGTGWNDADYDSKQCILNGSNSSSYSIIRMTSTSITNDCIIRGLQFTGIIATGYATDALYIHHGSPIVEYCKFFNNGSRGIRCDSSSMIARNNVFDDNDDCGMYTYKATGTVKFYNNLVVNSHVGFASDSSAANLYNNTIAHCYEGLRLHKESTVSVYNTILIYNEFAFYNYASDNNTVSFTNCRIWSNTNAIGGDGSTIQTKTTTTDPSIVGSGDTPYALQNISDCVNAGVGLTATQIGNTDIIGANRFFNTIEDLGAFEYQGDGIIIITSKTPKDGIKIPNISFGDLSFSCNRDITPRGGNITLYAEGGTIIKQLASTNADVVVNGRNVTVHVNATLVSGTRYYVNISPTAFDEGHGFYFAGISNDQDWDWITTYPDNFPGRALEFDGSNDYVNIADDNSLDVIDNYTLELWICPKAFASMSGIWSKFQSGNSGGIELCLTDEAPYQGIYYDHAKTASNVLSANTWYHIAVVRTLNNKLIYINGVQQSVHGDFYANSGNSDPVTIGSDHGGRYFNGKMDEIRIWSSARTEQQIREDMHLTSAGTEFRLISYWQFNDTTGSVLYDRKSGRDGTVTNMNDSDWVVSPIPIGAGNTNTQSIANGFTGNTIFTGTNFSMNVSSKVNTESYTVTKLNCNPNVFPTGVTKTYDSQYWILHKYGSGSCTANLTFTLSEDITQEEVNSLSSIKLFRRDYNATGSWRAVASASSCNTVDNSIIFNNINTYGQFIIARREGTADSVSGKMLNFNGSEAYLSGSGLPTEINTLTLEAWVYHRSLPAAAQRYITLNNEIAVLRYDGTVNGGTGEVHFYIKTGGIVRNLHSENVLTTNEWNHIAGTWDGTTMRIFLNGEEIASGTPGGTLDAVMGDFQISSASETFDGYMDEVRMYNKALTAQEIRESMYRTLGGYEDNLTAYWQFNDGSGSGTAKEIAGGSTATLNTMDITNDWMNSTVPIGSGVSATKTEAAGVVTFDNTGVSLNFSSQNGASVTTSKINYSPNLLPTDVDTVFNGQYWVIRRYGTGTFTANLTFTIAENFNASDETNPQAIKLYTRTSNSCGTWTILKRASSVNVSTNQVTFNDVNSFSQFLIVKKYDVPDVTTNDITAINTGSAMSGGTIPTSYGTNVIARGVCWSTNIHPSTANSHTTDGTGEGTFESTLFGLARNTRYYVRAYATNQYGTNYGEEKSFFTPNQLNNMLNFDGSNDYINTSIILPTQGTIEFWFKVGDVSSGCFWYETEKSTNSNWFCTIADGNLYTFIGSSGNSLRTDGLNAHTWYHCAVTWIKVGLSVSVQLYLDGNLKSSTVNPYQAPATILYIAARYDEANGLYGLLNGQLEEFRIWNVVRSASEIRNNMHQYIHPSSSNLLLYYDFNSSSGTTVSDKSTNGYNGTLINMTNASWVTSTAPLGLYGTQVRNTICTSTGQSGKTVSATITTGGDDTNYLGIYSYGEGDAPISMETFPTGVTKRSNVIWGVKQFGTVTSNLTFDYSGIKGTNTNEPTLKFLKRSDPSGDWTDITSMSTQNISDHSFTLSGVTNYSEFALGSGDDNSLPVEIMSLIANVNANEVTLMWQTATEDNCYGFEVQRSIFGSKNWEMVGVVRGNGNSNSKKSYSISDKNLGVRKYSYRLKMIDNDGNSKLSDELTVDIGKPASTDLKQNYPNTFNPSTKIAYQLANPSKVTLELYSMTGQLVSTLINEESNAGYYIYYFDAGKINSGLASGVYVYRLNAYDKITNETKLFVKKMTLMK